MVKIWAVVDRFTGTIREAWRRDPREAAADIALKLGSKHEIVELQIPESRVNGLAGQKLIGGMLVNARMIGT